MKLNPLLAFSDNDIWLLQGRSKALVVDPGDAQSALDCRQARTLQLWGILNTDHPADQSGGMGEAPLLIDAERSTHPILRSDAPAGIASVTRFDAQGVHGVSRFATLRS